MNRPLPVLLTICTAIGSAIVFSSFIAQNYFMAEWSEARERLALSQLAVEIKQLRFEIWQSARLSAAQEGVPPNVPLLELASFKLIQSLVNLDRMAGSRTAVDQAESRRAQLLHADELSKAASLFGRNSPSSVNALTEMANQLEASIQARSEVLDPSARFDTLYNAVLHEERWWNAFFLWAYIAGSAVLAAAYVLARHGRYAEREPPVLD